MGVSEQNLSRLSSRRVETMKSGYGSLAQQNLLDAAPSHLLQMSCTSILFSFRSVRSHFGTVFMEPATCPASSERASKAAVIVVGVEKQTRHLG